MMKVPPAIRAVFDTFPLVSLPNHDQRQPEQLTSLPLDTTLFVYSVDEDGWPLDPKCLAAAGILILTKHEPNIEISSPYISSAESLPLLVTKDKKVATSVDQIMTNCCIGEELALSPKIKAFKSLVDTWLDNAWHTTIMEPENSRARDIIYGDTQNRIPWPFSNMVATQLDEHLDSQNAKSKQGHGDDYQCSASNLHRIAMTLASLEAEISSPLVGDPGLLDILVFAYTWPITQVIPESALAALVSPMLRQHAHEVRSYLVNYGVSRSSSVSN